MNFTSGITMRKLGYLTCLLLSQVKFFAGNGRRRGGGGGHTRFVQQQSFTVVVEEGLLKQEQFIMVLEAERLSQIKLFIIPQGERLLLQNSSSWSCSRTSTSIKTAVHKYVGIPRHVVLEDHL